MMSRSRPNLLLIMCDQLRFDALRAAGNDFIQTPNLDRLCAEGVRFAYGYTESPVCVSARAICMTGQLPHRTGIFDNGYALPAGYPTVMSHLRAAGYFTQAIGKMHFSPVREHHGFDRMWLSEEVPRRVENDEFLQDVLSAGYGHVEEPHGIRHELYYVPQISQLPERLHTTAWTAQRTIDFIEERANENAPFFCWTSFIKPHPPFDPPSPWHRLYRSTDMPLPIRSENEIAWHTWFQRSQNRSKWMDLFPDDNLLRTMKAYYFACVSFVDSWVGEILTALETTKQRENTLIMFVADHGEFLGDHFAFGKRNYHEPACHIPYILSWPGTLPEGVVREHLVGLQDVTPTLLSAAGMQLDQPEFDGMPLLSVAQDGSSAGRPYLFGQIKEKNHGMYCAMNEEWKYIYCAPDRLEILLNYRDAGNELVNHAHEPGLFEVKRELKEALFAHFRSANYEEPLDGDDWALHPQPTHAWLRLDEMENKEQVGRGWQFAKWTQNYPVDARQRDQLKNYRFIDEEQ